MKERTIVSAFAMFGSLTAYYYAKHNAKDPAPLIMIGGFMGALFGEVVSQATASNTSSKTKSKPTKQLEEPKSS